MNYQGQTNNNTPQCSDPRPQIKCAAMAMHNAANLLRLCFLKLYPDKSQHSPSYIATTTNLPFLDVDIPQAITELAQQSLAVTNFANTIFLDACSYQVLAQAATQSDWIPPEYSSNEWLADCTHFLRHGHPKPAAQLEGQPIDMVLHCPVCHTQHVDVPVTDHEYTAQLHESSWWELGGEKPERWMNPPHKSHLCHNCGHIWRPADVPTNGVLFVQTKGTKDSPLPKQQRADPGTIAPNADKGLLRKALGLKS